MTSNWILRVQWARRTWRGTAVVCAGLLTVSPLERVIAQGPPVILVDQASGTVEDYSFIYVPAPPPPPEIKVHDIITIEIDEKAEVLVSSRFNRQRTGAYKAELKEFVRIDDNGNLEPAALNGPTIDAGIQNRLQTIGNATDAEGIAWNIAATVVDVMPNGTVVLEARKSIRNNQDFMEYRMTGRIDRLKIKPDRSAKSEDIAELQIVRDQKGKIYDSTKVAWGTKLFDLLSPF